MHLPCILVPLVSICGGWGLGAGDRGLGAGGWGLLAAGWGMGAGGWTSWARLAWAGEAGGWAGGDNVDLSKFC